MDVAAKKIYITPAQAKIMGCRKKSRIVNAGRRFGKSFLSGYEALAQALNKPGSVIQYIAPTLPMGRDIMWNGWIKKDNHVPDQYIAKKNEQQMILEFKNGSTFQIKTADDPDSLRGTGLDLVIIDEAAMIKDPDFWETITPNLSDKWHDGRALIISTPKGYNWFYDLFQKAKYDPDYRDEWEAFQFTSMEGGNIDPAFIEKKRRTMTKKMFEQEFCASFETMSNRVYYNFDRDLNSVEAADWYGQCGDVHVGIDFNVNPMTAVCFALDKDERHRQMLVAFDEVVDRNSDTQALANILKERFPGCSIRCYPDPTCRKRQTNAVGGVTDMDILERNGFEVFVPHGPYATKDKFNCVNTRLCDADGFRAVRVVKDKCPELRKSWDGYTYKDSLGKSEPDKTGGLEHISDAAAYCINYVLPLRDKTVTKPLVYGV